MYKIKVNHPSKAIKEKTAMIKNILNVLVNSILFELTHQLNYNELLLDTLFIITTCILLPMSLSLCHMIFYGVIRLNELPLYVDLSLFTVTVFFIPTPNSFARRMINEIIREAN